MSTQPLGSPRGVRLNPSAVERARDFWSARHSAIYLATAWVGGALLLLSRLNQGWIHHDDGSIAHTAQRVLEGELPHRDFADLYTGGLAFFDAAIFWLLGEDLYWLRLPLFILFLLFIPCFFVLARRFVGPAGAFLATLVAITWSVPSYPAPMPSWYVLYFSVFGAYAVVRYLEGGGRRWLLIAGVLGGLSISFKIVGIWYVVAVLLTLAVSRSPGRDRESPQWSRASVAYRAAVGAIAAGSLLLTIAVLKEKLEAPAFVSLLVPIAVLCAVVIVLSLRGAVGVEAGSVGVLVRDAGLFLYGVALPLVALLAPYAASGAIGALVNGVLVSPQTRFDFAYRSMPHLVTLLWAIPIAVYLVGRVWIPQARRRFADIVASALVLAAVGGLWLAEGPRVSYPLVWGPAHALGPFVVAVGALAFLQRDGDRSRRDISFLCVAMAAFMALLQFPFAAPLYYCYIAPLILLAALAASSYAGVARGVLPAVLLVVLVIFGFRFIDRQSFWTLGVVYRPDEHTVLMGSDRASIRVLPVDAWAYARITSLVRRHANGDFIYAGPDAPQVYFLTDKRNPTRSILDFLDTTDSARGIQLVTTLRERRVSLIVLDHEPLQSDPHPPQVISRLRQLYPFGEEVGRFEVRWRDPLSR